MSELGKSAIHHNIGMISAYGPRLPTWAVQQIGSYRGYTGRDANALGNAALGPSCAREKNARLSQK